MTTLNRILIGVILALSIFGGVQYAVYVGLRLKLSAAEADLQAAKYNLAVAQATVQSTQAALAAKTKAVALADARAAASRTELQRALKANPEWAAAPVPDAVWRGLYERAPKAGPADAAQRTPG